MSLFGGPASWVAGAGQAAADVMAGTGGDNDGAIEDANSVREARNRLWSGAATYTSASVLDTANNLGIGGVTDEDVREEWVATGGLRDTIDTAFEYDGTWGGTEDSADLAGPAGWGSEGSVVDAVHTGENENVSAEERKTRWLIYGAIVVVASIALAPLLNLATASVDAVGGE